MKYSTLITACTLALAISKSSYSQEVDFRIAVVVPMQSNISHIAKEIINGSKLSVLDHSQIQPWAGLTKTNIELVFWDDAANKAVALSVANQVIEKPFHAVVGNFNSGTAIPVSTLYESAKIVNVSTGATNPLLTGRNYHYVFRSIPDDYALTGDLVTYLDGLRSAEAIFAIHDKTTHGEYVVKGALSRLTSSEQSNIISIAPSENAKTLDLSRIESQGARSGENFIILGSMDRFAADLIDRLPKERKWTILGADGVLTKWLIERVKKFPNVKIIGISSSLEESVESLDPDFSESYSRKFSTHPTQYAAKAYDVVAMLIKAFELAKTPDSTQISIQLRNMGVYEGLMGPINFDDQGDNASRVGFVYEISNRERIFRDVLLNGNPYHRLKFLTSK